MCGSSIKVVKQWYHYTFLIHNISDVTVSILDADGDDGGEVSVAPFPAASFSDLLNDVMASALNWY